MAPYQRFRMKTGTAGAQLRAIGRERFLREGIASALALGSIATSAAPARSAQFELKCGSNLPADHPSSVRLAQLFAAVEQETGGRVHVQFFPNSALGGDAAMLSQLRLGALGLYYSSPAILATIAPIADIWNLGFLFKDQEEGLRVMGGPLGDYVRQEATSKGVHAFRSYFVSGMGQVCSNPHPVRTPDDLKGFRIRVVESRIQVDFFKGLDASPTTLSFAETYTALQTKLIDGESLNFITFDAAKHYEVEKYISVTNHAFGSVYLLANGDVWNSFPADIQTIFERNTATYAALQRKDQDSLTASLQAKLTARGIAINQVNPAPFRSHLDAYYTTWASTFGPAPWSLLQRSLGRRLT